MLRTASWFFVVGMLVAMALELAWRAIGYYGPGGYVIERAARVLWPSVLFKMALDDAKDSWTRVLFVYTVSFVSNGLLYAVLGLLLSLGRSLASRPR